MRQSLVMILLIGMVSGAASGCLGATPAGESTPTPGTTSGATSTPATLTPATTHAPATPTPGTPAGTPASSRHPVFIILLENVNWSAIKGSGSAPYINTKLLPMASYATQYYNPPGLHPSEPNYLWLEAGSSFGVKNDNPPAANHQSTTDHLVTQLNTAGKLWKSYQEDISGTTCPLTSKGLYDPKHNPMVFFDDVTDNRNPASAYCIAHVRPFTELVADLESDHVADYNFITPNLCDNMHNTCAPLKNRVAQGDAWLAKTVPAILASAAWKNGGVLFITWDESEKGDFPIGMIVLSPLAKGGGYSNSIHYTHSSTLRTIQELLGVGPLLRDAANAVDLRDLFASFP